MKVRQLIPELKEKAKKELFEPDDARIEEDIQHIKDWLKKQPHLKAREDDQWILSFLRGCKFSLERTKEKLDFFYTVRSMLPEFFADRDPMRPEIQEVLNTGMFLPLKNKRDPTAPGAILLRGGGYDPDKIKQTDILKTNMMFMDLGIMDDDFSLVNGVHIVQDLKGMNTGHIMNPSLAKKAMTIFQKTYPNRTKGVHFFNLPSFFEMLFNLFKPLLTEKMKNRMNIHTEPDLSGLFEKVPQHLFPTEYGGEGGTIAEITEANKKLLESHRDWFLEDAKYHCDEKKRPGKPKTSDELFGIEGSFRKLNVD